MNIYFETIFSLGIAMHRIEKAIKQYSPNNINWVEDFEESDVAFHHIIGKTDQRDTARINVKPYVIVFHCFEKGWVNQENISEDNRNDDFYKQLFKNALAVITFYPLHKWFEGNFIMTPWGVDSDTFYLENLGEREYQVLTTGYVSKTEGIREMYEASLAINKEMIHLGGFLDFGLGYNNLQGIDDGTLNDLYNNCKYVSGLRRGMGFEMGVLEGALAGCIPIVFENSCYNWFKDFALYVPETIFDDLKGFDIDLVDNILKVFKSPYNRLNEDKINKIKENFDWRNLCQTIWQLIPFSQIEKKKMIPQSLEKNNKLVEKLLNNK